MGSFSGERAFGLLCEQVELGPRNPGSRGHQRARSWIAQRLGEVAKNVIADDFTGQIDGKAVGLTNFMATIGPSGARPVLLAAHWDTRPWADQDPDPSKRAHPVIGANDGASGVAVVLEVARVLRPRVPTVLVLFDGEDLGRDLVGYFQGSRHYVKRLRATVGAPGAVRRPRWGILLDMVGDRDLKILPEALSVEAAPGVVTRIWKAARQAGFSDVFVEEPGPLIFDDHYPLIEAGIPTADLIDFSYPPWHTTSDTANQCAPRSLEAVGKTVVLVIESER